MHTKRDVGHHVTQWQSSIQPGLGNGCPLKVAKKTADRLDNSVLLTALFFKGNKYIHLSE
ncbi:MAG: hypothetical protein Q8K02_12855 [Flavobacterium sp.]|nr:hypothetical protein [Flavobacterium sp.]